MKPQEKKTIKSELKELPKNPRGITEESIAQGKSGLTWKMLISIFAILILVIIVSLETFDIYRNLNHMKKAEAEREKISKEINFWENEVKNHPDYRDAYLELAVLEYRFGDSQKAKEFTKKTLELDPIYKPALDFKMSL